MDEYEVLTNFTVAGPGPGKTITAGSRVFICGPDVGGYFVEIHEPLRPYWITVLNGKDLNLFCRYLGKTAAPAPLPRRSSFTEEVMRAMKAVYGPDKCECGADAVGGPRHSDYCPKSERGLAP